MRYFVRRKSVMAAYVSGSIITHDDVVIETSAAWTLNVGRAFSTDLMLQLQAQKFDVFIVDDAGKKRIINPLY